MAWVFLILTSAKTFPLSSSTVAQLLTWQSNKKKKYYIYFSQLDWSQLLFKNMSSVLIRETNTDRLNALKYEERGLGRVSAKRKSCTDVRTTLISGGKSIILLERSQALPARPYNKDRMKVKRLRW
jgi:hypothetical protein